MPHCRGAPERPAVGLGDQALGTTMGTDETMGRWGQTGSFPYHENLQSGGGAHLSAYSVPRDTILSWELSPKTPIFLAELLCSVERESPSKPSSTISKAE